MASLRARITVSYAFALVVTVFGFVIFQQANRRAAIIQDLSERADFVAAVGERFLEQVGTEGEITVIENDLVGRVLTPRIKSRLDALVPEYLIVADSTRIIYQSPAVRRLYDRDRERFIAASFRRTPVDRFSLLSLDSLASGVVMAARFEDPRTSAGVRRVTAAVSARALQVASEDTTELVFKAIPVLLLVAALTAWWIAGSTLGPIGRIVNDVEAITDGRSLHRRIPVDDDDEIGRLAETLNAMIARLESSFAALRRFTADASHELKTPLTVLRADLERAMSAPAKGNEQLVALEEALNETARMADLVESLLTLARADEGRFDLHREPVDVEALVRDVGETAHILCEMSGLHSRITASIPVSVNGDRERLRQLFLNLITNAVKYTARGGSVELALERKDDQVHFSVKDTGLGIAGADLPFIFDRFWRVDRARSRSERGGVGLGLAISLWIAQAHGGSITVASRMGKGSTFTVILPVLEKTEGAAEA
jgi:signal transduction histidine kinase